MRITFGILLALQALAFTGCGTPSDSAAEYHSRGQRDGTPTRIVDRIDATVTLTHEQRVQILALFANEIKALQNQPPNQDLLPPAIQAQIRALLTPEQQQKFDANPTAARDIAVQAYIKNFLQTSPGVAAWVGQVSQVEFLRDDVTPPSSPGIMTLGGHEIDQGVQGRAVLDIDSEGYLTGHSVYKVTGSKGYDTFRIAWGWERRLLSSKITILRITTKAAEIPVP